MERPPLVVLLLGFSSIYKKPSSCRSSAVGNPSLPPVAARPPVDNGKPLPTGLLAATRHLKMTGATWRRLFSVCLRRSCWGPLAAVRLGGRVAGCALRPYPTRTGCPLRFSVKGPCPRPSGCGPLQPLDPAPSLESHEKRPESPDMARSR